MSAPLTPRERKLRRKIRRLESELAFAQHQLATQRGYSVSFPTASSSGSSVKDWQTLLLKTYQPEMRRHLASGTIVELRP